MLYGWALAHFLRWLRLQGRAGARCSELTADLADGFLSHLRGAYPPHGGPSLGAAAAQRCSTLIRDLTRWAGGGPRGAGLPATAIGSFYGMNLIVYDRTQPLQLAVALGLMIVLTGAMLVWARRQGWW